MENQDNSPPANLSDQQPAVKDTDFTDWDAHQLKKYKEAGIPGISKVTADQMSQAVELYLNGKSYKEISQNLNIKKVMILYLSEKYSWVEIKKEYLMDLSQHVANRVAQAKLESVDFTVDTFQFFKNYYKRKMDLFAKTKDDRVLETMNSRFLPHMFKAMEALNKIGEENTPPAPSVTVNVNTQPGGKAPIVDVTSESKNLEEVFAILADKKREEAQKQASEAAEQNAKPSNPQVILRKKEDK